MVHIDRLVLRNAQGIEGPVFGEAMRQALSEQLVQANLSAGLLQGAAARETVRATLPMPHSATTTQLARAAAGAVVDAIQVAGTPRGNAG